MVLQCYPCGLKALNIHAKTPAEEGAEPMAQRSQKSAEGDPGNGGERGFASKVGHSSAQPPPEAVYMAQHALCILKNTWELNTKRPHVDLGNVGADGEAPPTDRFDCFVSRAKPDAAML